MKSQLNPGCIAGERRDEQKRNNAAIRGLERVLHEKGKGEEERGIIEVDEDIAKLLFANLIPECVT